MAVSETGGVSGMTGSSAPIIWGNVPQRNPNFTGRIDLLGQLRQRVTSEVTALVPHTLHGYGGVGKTQLAIEYVHRHAAEYQVVWWVSADQPTLIRSTLAALAPRLGITGIAPGRVEELVTAVLDALRRGDPYPDWLLVFDNADQPEDLYDIIPTGGTGHVLVTSRNHRWQNRARILEVEVFPREESLEFLRRRVPAVAAADANKLADKLGDLPLALEQAGALMSETAMSVASYLDLLDTEAEKILAENQPADYPHTVAAAWSLSMARLREQMPNALELLYRCAYFGPEPIPLEIIEQRHLMLAPSSLRDTIQDHYQRNRAIRELGRYSLVRIDNFRRTLQMHRIIQTLIRKNLSEEEQEVIRHDVHLLLEAAAPDVPDDVENWPKYAELVAHADPSALLSCHRADIRRLATNMVRYLFMTGDFASCEVMAENALKEWTVASGTDDLHVLVMSRHKVNLLFATGRFDEAFALSEEILPRMRATLGLEHEETLGLTNTYGGLLRARGNFNAALELDEVSLELHRKVFGRAYPETFNAVNNLAVDYSLTNRYEEALRLHEDLYQDRSDYYYGRDDHPRVVSTSAALARDLRLIGRYGEARQRAERVYLTYQEIVRQRVMAENHPSILLQAKDLSVIRRKAGAVAEAFELAKEVDARYRRVYGDNHPESLAAAINLGNAQRLAGELSAAAELIEQTVDRYGRVLGIDHPFTHGCALNLAVVRRQLGDALGARKLLEKAMDGFLRNDSIGADHHYTLTCATNLASALADLGDTEGARQLGEDTLRRFRAVLGLDHPHTLACASNLSIDLATLGHRPEAGKLRNDTVERYVRMLGENYIDVRFARNGDRLDFDFEPTPF
ncbi:FxSxx-COOH system tetratricopeptide repeat protein [Streptosporangium sp. CA-135522]|uniref:FxSxx-COOH system tetratricopeptide repeat protein n=1 Tax=Streptosporangium sp. CA-135522 TaxID=3240072 RepID=UPI003D8A8761